MPVTFEQPGPVAPGLSYMGGAADEYSRIHQDFTQMAGITAGIAGEQVKFAQQQALAGQSYAQQAALAQQHFGQQQYLAQQKSQLEQSQQAQGLSQAEEMRLQRLQGALSSVASDPTLSDAEKNQYRTMLQTGIDPLQQRKAQQQQAMMDQQLDMMKQQAQHQAVQDKTYSDFMGMQPEDMVKKVKDDDGNVMGALVQTQPGKFSFQHVPPPYPLQPQTGFHADGTPFTYMWDQKTGKPIHIKADKPEKDNSAVLAQKAMADENKYVAQDHKDWAAHHQQAIKLAQDWQKNMLTSPSGMPGDEAVMNKANEYAQAMAGAEMGEGGKPMTKKQFLQERYYSRHPEKRPVAPPPPPPPPAAPPPSVPPSLAPPTTPWQVNAAVTAS